jgi:hypothetical protein
MSNPQPVAWRVRFNCPEEGVGMWREMPSSQIDLFTGKRGWEVEALYVKAQPLTDARLEELGIDLAVARMIEAEHGISYASPCHV